ncbi:MAG TPA: hypothetical protein VF815_20315 [Myxococcaceae bacterium]|jgi:hypothetical protein
MRLDSSLISLANLFRARALETATPPEAPPAAPEAAPQEPSAYFQDTFEAAPAARAGLPALSVPSAPERPAGPQPVNEAEGAQAAQQWIGDKAAVAQKTEVDCGEASLTQLKKAKDAAAPASDDQKREEVRSTTETAHRAIQDRFQLNLADGTRPEEMGAMLGAMGIEVTRGVANYDTWAISEALKSGQLGMAMVDSNALANAKLPPDQQKQEPGALHWVTIDGFNKGELAHDTMDDQFRVKDPVKGEYWVSAKDLLKAMDVARIQHGGTGGMMLLQNRADATSQEAREALARSNVDQTASLGNGNGIGSKRGSTRESS